ncbi:MAG: bifunctional UDP-sugar hydrolase/5'-nucleotidase [Candidatus Wallbacteria bacterium]|nr:bifunctional UDP-sugar hydrolase/5'-nucleotidase [Candidatus Wallbacteria bacterium]
MIKLIFTLTLLSAFSLQAETFYICHINDFHGYLYKDEGCQIARIETLYKSISLRHNPCLLFDTGDFLSGSVYANFFQGESVARIYASMPFTFLTFGNHEFDYPSPGLQELNAKYSLPFLSSNVVSRGGVSFTRSIVMTIGTKKIGIMALTTESTASISNLKAVCDFQFLATLKETSTILKEFKKKKADFIIVISHLGFDKDQELAMRFPQLDLIIGGHSHTVLEKPFRIGKTAIVQAGAQGRYFGFLRIRIEDCKSINGGLIEVKPYLTEDPFIKSIAEEYRARLKESLGQPIAALDEPLPIKGNGSGEAKIGNLLSDALRKETGADIALINAGGVRKGLPQGKITGEDLYNTLPFNNNVVFYLLDKKAILEMIRQGLSGATEDSLQSRFDVISGISYRAVLKNGEITDLEIMKDGKTLNDKQQYLVAVPDYLAGGGDGFTVFKNRKQLENPLAGTGIRELILSYFKKNPHPTPALENRFEIRFEPLQP